MSPAWSRRLKTIPALTVISMLLLVTLPLTIPLALGVDLLRWVSSRTPFMATRILAFGVSYAWLEIAGLVMLAGVWLITRGERLRSATFRIQLWWASAVLAAVRRIFGLDVNAEGLDALTETPFVLVARHTSIVDNLLPAHFISRPFGVRLAYVMKAELEVDPCLDVAGNRLPNVFVRRGAGETEGEVGAIRALGSSLGPGEGVLIYPEGTRFQPEKMARAVDRLANRSPDLYEIARGFRTVLPPRPAGTMALIDSTGGDVVVMAHRGLDGFARVADIWRGGMVHQAVDVLFWRIDRASIPSGRAERLEWLYRVWEDIDRWVVDRVRPREARA